MKGGRGLGSARDALAWLAAFAPGLVLLAVVVSEPGILRGGAHRLPFLLSAFLSVVGCALVVRAAGARAGATRWVARVALVLEALVVGAQFFMRSAFQSELDATALRSVRLLGPAALEFLRTQPRGLASALGAPLLVALILPVCLARVAPTPPANARKAALLAGLLAFMAAFGFGFALPLDRALSPDVLFAGSLARYVLPDARHASLAGPGFVVLPLPHERAPLPVPPLTATPARPRSVLLLLGESVRADSSCVEPTTACKNTPFTNAALPNRIPFLQMRALDSTTAISLGVLWTGLAVDASREDLHTAPLVFDYARAAGFHTAYWTSQNLEFGGAGAWLSGIPFERHVSGRDFDPDAREVLGVDDARLLPVALEQLATLGAPYFAIVQLLNTHHPYRIDAREAPFAPESTELGPSHAAALENRYDDAIFHQDHLIADFLVSLRALPASRDVVVVYVSDHGESFYEKGSPFHSLTLDDTEIHVPAWIDAPPGTLTEEEERRLRALKDTPVTMIDVLPTILDLLGIGDAPGMAPFRARMPGASLVRPHREVEPTVHLTNCTGLWGCVWSSWGVIRGTRKYISSVKWDTSPHCYDVRDDPREEHDLGREGCDALLPEYGVVEREGQALFSATYSKAKRE